MVEDIREYGSDMMSSLEKVTFVRTVEGCELYGSLLIFLVRKSFIQTTVNSVHTNQGSKVRLLSNLIQLPSH